MNKKQQRRRSKKTIAIEEEETMLFIDVQLVGVSHNKAAAMHVCVLHICT